MLIKAVFKQPFR